jgi:hypothetical protein
VGRLALALHFDRAERLSICHIEISGLPDRTNFVDFLLWRDRVLHHSDVMRNESAHAAKIASTLPISIFSDDESYEKEQGDN